LQLNESLYICTIIPAKRFQAFSNIKNLTP
jgi:hypothetical protein